MRRFTQLVTTRAGVLPGYERDYMTYWWQQFLLSAAWGFVFPIRAIFLYEHGMSLAFYGAVTAGGAALVLLSQGYLGRLSDRLHARVRFITGSLWVMAPVVGAITFFSNIWVLASLQVLDTLAVSTFFTISNAVVSSYSASGQVGRGMSWYRMSGSLGWIIATFLLGFVVDGVGMRGAHVLASLVMFGLIVYTVKNAKEPPFEPDEEVTSVQPGQPVRRTNTARYRLPVVFVLMLVALVGVQFSQSAGFTYRAIFFKHDIGTTDLQLGWVMSLQAVLEVPFMLWLGLLSDIWGRRLLLALGFVATGLRWLFLSMIFAPAWLYPLQFLHAVSYTSTAVIVIAYASDLVPRRHRGMAMGLLNAAQNMGAVSAPIIAGALAEAFGLRFVLRIAAYAAFAGTLMFITYDFYGWISHLRHRRAARLLIRQNDSPGAPHAAVTTLPVEPRAT